MSIEDAKNAIYEAVNNDNEELNERIKDLKDALKAEGEKQAVFDPEKLIHNNREGRKRMQSYFKKRGVIVKFEKAE